VIAPVLQLRGFEKRDRPVLQFCGLTKIRKHGTIFFVVEATAIATILR
jgi:hypothetical protein